MAVVLCDKCDHWCHCGMTCMDCACSHCSCENSE